MEFPLVPCFVVFTCYGVTAGAVLFVFTCYGVSAGALLCCFYKLWSFCWCRLCCFYMLWSFCWCRLCCFYMLWSFCWRRALLFLHVMEFLLVPCFVVFTCYGVSAGALLCCFYMLWSFCWCRFRLFMRVNSRPHTLQANLRSPVWMARCCFRFPGDLNAFWQKRQTNGRSPHARFVSTILLSS